MEVNKTNSSISTITAILFLLMIIVNALSVILPINGVTPGQVSDSYRNLFAPAGMTFSIWGLIYLLLAVYTLYQLGFFQIRNKKNNSDLIEKVGLYFSISSIANVAWIFAWHYQVIVLSMLLMIIILSCLIVISKEIGEVRLSTKEKFFIRLPFSVYFGWITVATIANATILLVSLGWNGFGISEIVWTVITIVIGSIIGIVTMLKNKDIAYGLVVIWAYTGILIKHTSPKGFAGQYPVVIITVMICIAFLFMGEAYILINNKRKLIR